MNFKARITISEISPNGCEFLWFLNSKVKQHSSKASGVSMCKKFNFT